jgi:hypothetical protein
VISIELDPPGDEPARYQARMPCPRNTPVTLDVDAATRAIAWMAPAIIARQAPVRAA